MKGCYAVVPGLQGCEKGSSASCASYHAPTSTSPIFTSAQCSRKDDVAIADTNFLLPNASPRYDLK